MKEQKACKERKEIKRTGGKRDKEISGMEKKKRQKKKTKYALMMPLVERKNQ